MYHLHSLHIVHRAVFLTSVLSVVLQIPHSKFYHRVYLSSHTAFLIY